MAMLRGVGEAEVCTLDLKVCPDGTYAIPGEGCSQLCPGDPVDSVSVELVSTAPEPAPVQIVSDGPVLNGNPLPAGPSQVCLFNIGPVCVDWKMLAIGALLAYAVWGRK